MPTRAPTADALDYTTEVVPITSLKPHPRNYQQHTDDNLDHIAESLRTHGYYKNVFIAEDNTLLAGHGVIEAATTRLGWTHVPVHRLAYPPDHPEALKVLVGDNDTGRLNVRDDAQLAGMLSELRDTGVSLVGTGWDEAGLEGLLAQVGMGTHGAGGTGDGEDVEPQIDRAEELREKWGTEVGQLWGLGEHRIICGDCTTPTVVAQLLNGTQPRLMVTDPPYGVDYDANWRNEAADKGYIQHAERRVGKVLADDRVDWRAAWELFPGDVVYCWHAGRHASAVQVSLEVCDFEMRCQIIWAKQMFAISRGHYHWQHEPCWYAVRKGATASWIGDHSQTTLWQIQWDKNIEGGHSTQKPLECMARPIRNHDAQEVYDPFLGSGTTLMACHTLGRCCFGCEISPGYLGVCLERFFQATGVEPVLLDR